RNLVGRQREYDEYKRKQSGRMIKEEHPEVDMFGRAVIDPNTGQQKTKSYNTQRDENGNIKRYAEFDKFSAAKAGKQIWREFSAGLSKAGLAGGAVGLAGIVAGAPLLPVAT